MSGHFAGTDQERADAFVRAATDPSSDAVWFARGGYGSCRIAHVIADLADNPVARDKLYCGYSDHGNLLGALYRHGFPHVAHTPIPADIRREHGESAVYRALAWMLRRDPEALEPGLTHGQRHAAFNMMTLAMMTGTDLWPNLRDHVVLLEEVAEHLYAVDRILFHLTAHLAQAGVAGIRLGRVSDVPENDRPFGIEAQEIAAYWCERHGVPLLGPADIGHDIENKVVPFGLRP